MEVCSSVRLTSGCNKGNPMEAHPMEAHLRHQIRPEFFDRGLEFFAETADEVGWGGRRSSSRRGRTASPKV